MIIVREFGIYVSSRLLSSQQQLVLTLDVRLPNFMSFLLLDFVLYVVETLWLDRLSQNFPVVWNVVSITLLPNGVCLRCVCFMHTRSYSIIDNLRNCKSSYMASGARSIGTSCRNNNSRLPALTSSSCHPQCRNNNTHYAC